MPDWHRTTFLVTIGHLTLLLWGYANPFLVVAYCAGQGKADDKVAQSDKRI